MMNLPIPQGMLDEPRLLEASADQRWAWVLSFRHLTARFNRQTKPGVWTPTDGVIKRPTDKGQEASIFGGYASFDEMVSVGLIVEHPIKPGVWMPFGFPRDSQVQYAASAMRTIPATAKRVADAKAKKAALAADVTSTVTSDVTFNVTKTRQEKRGSDSGEERVYLPLNLSTPPHLADLPASDVVPTGAFALGKGSRR